MRCRVSAVKRHLEFDNHDESLTHTTDIAIGIGIGTGIGIGIAIGVS
jgi:hypothetical protein